MKTRRSENRPSRALEISRLQIVESTYLPSRSRSLAARSSCCEFSCSGPKSTPLKGLHTFVGLGQHLEYFINVGLDLNTSWRTVAPRVASAVVKSSIVVSDDGDDGGVHVRN